MEIFQKKFKQKTLKWGFFKLSEHPLWINYKQGMYILEGPKILLKWVTVINFLKIQKNQLKRFFMNWCLVIQESKNNWASMKEKMTLIKHKQKKSPATEKSKCRINQNERKNAKLKMALEIRLQRSMKTITILSGFTLLI